MSRELADKILRIKDQNQIRDLLSKHRSSIDKTFVEILLEASNQHKQDQKFDAAIGVLKTLFTAGQVTRNTYMIAFSLLQVAQIEISRHSFDRSINTVQRCITECDKVSETRCVDLKARAHHLLGQLHYQQYNRRDLALQNLRTASAIYETLQKLEEVERVRSIIHEIEQQPENSSQHTPLGDILEEITISRSQLTEIQSQIKTIQAELEDLIHQRDSLQTEVQQLSAECRDLNQRKVRTQRKLSTMTGQLDKLQKRISLLSTAQQFPLWAAVIRSEIQDGEITDLTLPLLSRLQAAHDKYATPLILEIRARNGIPPNEMVDLSGLEGEHRLFAGVANAKQLENIDSIKASETLVDAWETYLNTLDGSIQ